MERKLDFVYTMENARKNARDYKGYFIGTYALEGDSRYVSVLFDKNMNFLDESICDVDDMKTYVDEKARKNNLC